MSFLLQPIRPFEFTSPVFDCIKSKFLWVKPLSTFIFANQNLRRKFSVREVNERIIEVPFILGNLPKTGKILDVGACESPVSLMLASLGYKVWANDTRPYHFSHPNLTINVGSIISFQKKNYFDTVICLSVLEHIGLSAYGNTEKKDLDKKAIDKIYDVLKPCGKLLLTTPIDSKHRDLFEARVYTIPELKNYLYKFSKIDIKVGYKNKAEIWNVSDRLPNDWKSFGEHNCAVALISATK